MTARPAVLDYAAHLAEPTRARILRLFDRHELAVSELCRVLQLPQSTVSRHLKVLGEGGWVVSRREGTSHVYRRAADLDARAVSLWQLVRDDIGATPEGREDQRRLDAVVRQRRSRSQEFFTESAEEWDRLRDQLFGSRFDLEALLGLLDPTWTVGDLGCGTGRVSRALAPFVGRVIAVDGSPAMLDAAARRLQPSEPSNELAPSTTEPSEQTAAERVELRRGELEALPIDDAMLDAATLVLALHHAPEPDDVLREAARVLRPGGRLLVVDMLPHAREDYRRTMGHIWLGFEPETIRQHLGAAGFAPVRVTALPSDPDAEGPGLFVATAARA
ncbi:MAG: metalloregulator ArsR/SmtB family transcription factor [Acidobacteriota bacterium]